MIETIFSKILREEELNPVCVGVWKRVFDHFSLEGVDCVFC